MLISDLLSKVGRHKRSKRIGRGIGSGHGKTAGRGTKGMGAHSSDRPHRMNEGGQMPLFRRIPKRGFSNAQFRTEYQVVNLRTLEERFENGARVTAQALKDMGLIHDASGPVKILGTGELTKKLDVEATAFSASAAEKIARAGGEARQSTDALPKLKTASKKEKAAKRKARLERAAAEQAAAREKLLAEQAAAREEARAARKAAKKEAAAPAEPEAGEKKKKGKKEQGGKTEKS